MAEHYEGYVAFAAFAEAAVSMAVKDYIRAICYQDTGKIYELERYFKSDLIQLHTKADGKRLMHLTKELCKKYNYDYKTILKLYYSGELEEET